MDDGNFQIKITLRNPVDFFKVLRKFFISALRNSMTMARLSQNFHRLTEPYHKFPDDVNRTQSNENRNRKWSHNCDRTANFWVIFDCVQLEFCVRSRSIDCPLLIGLIDWTIAESIEFNRINRTEICCNIRLIRLHSTIEQQVLGNIRLNFHCVWRSNRNHSIAFNCIQLIRRSIGSIDIVWKFLIFPAKNWFFVRNPGNSIAFVFYCFWKSRNFKRWFISAFHRHPPPVAAI